MHEQRKTKQKNDDKTPEGAVPAYLLDRDGQSRAKVLSNMIKQKRKEKAVSTEGIYTLRALQDEKRCANGNLVHNRKIKAVSL